MFDVPRDAPERAADPDVRKQNLRRVARLFRPHRRRLSAVLFLILISSALGIVSPFLLKSLLDTAIPQKDATFSRDAARGFVIRDVIRGRNGQITIVANERAAE